MPILTSLQVQHDDSDDRGFDIHLVRHRLSHLAAYTGLKVIANKPVSLLQLKKLDICAASRFEVAGLNVDWKATVDTKVHAFPFLKKLVIQWPLELEDQTQPRRSPSEFGEVPVSMFCRQLRSLEEMVLDVPFLEVLTVTDSCLEATNVLQHLCSLTLKIVYRKAYKTSTRLGMHIEDTGLYWLLQRSPALQRFGLQVPCEASELAGRALFEEIRASNEPKYPRVRFTFEPLS
jgi:hypothetical protein